MLVFTMQFFNKVSLAVALLASSSIAAPLYRNDNTQAGAAGSKCSDEGRVVCGNEQFQVCASGQWSVSMRLAAGTDCSVFGTGADAGIGSLPANPSTIPVSPVPAPSNSAVLSTPSIPVPTTTTISVPTASSAPATETTADSELGGGFHQSHGGPAVTPTTTSSIAVPTTPAQQPTTAPVATEAPSTVESTTPAPTGSTDGGNTTPGQLEDYRGPEPNYPHAEDGKWVDFDTLWDLNKEVCERPDNGGKGPLLKKYIQQVGQEANFDARVILAIILQESTCNIGVSSTNGGVNNPGLMQSHNGVSFDGSDNSILQMVRDGVTGTNQDGGEGLSQYIEGRQGKLYTGLRAYNSGPNGVDPSNLYNLPAGTGTASYCSDVANRLTGAKVEHM